MSDEHPRRAAATRTDRRVVLLIFLLSGTAGLVYEVVWARQLVLVFGNTTQAISAILTGFFGGMAIGSVIGGRLADRVRSPLRLYAILELLVVVAVIATPFTFRGLHEVYRGAFGSLEESPTLLALVRFGLAILALGPATVLMGATLPTLSRFLVRDHAALGGEFGSLYTVNTVGGIIGTLAAGIVLIELLGLSGTLLVGACCSGLAGLTALALSRRAPALAPRLSDGPGAALGGDALEDEPETLGSAVAALPDRLRLERPSAGSLARPRLALAVAFVSGLTSLGYQNLWTRILASGTGSASYIFTGILAVFLAGIALGAFIYARWLSRTRQPLALLGLAELLLSIIVLAGLGVATRFFIRLDFLQQLLVVVAPATLVMGLVFPMSSAIVADSDERVGTSAGLLLGANTLGAICGTFVVPFVLMPLLTSPRAVVLIAGANALVGLALLWEARQLLPALRVAASGAAVLVAAGAGYLLVHPNRLVLDPAVQTFRRSHIGVLASVEDEIASTQATVTGRSSFRLWVTGTSMTGLTVDTRAMAYITAMTRPNAKSMAVIAFGMGSGFRSALKDGLKVDAVELVPSVPTMFKFYYPDAAQVRANPNGRVIIADGRNHMDLTTSRYDTVIVDPPPPYNSSGTAVLYSQEFYEASKARLTPGGVMEEWEYFGQSIDEFRSHVRTFSSVFPHVALVFSPARYGMMMLGSDAPISLSDGAVRGVLSRPGVLADLNGAYDSPKGVTSEDAWAGLIESSTWISDAAVDRFGQTGTLITDDRPYTEYDLLRHMFGPKSPPMTWANLRALNLH